MIKVMCVIGTRPEAIKMAPIIKLLLKESPFQTTVVATAQHRQMLDQVLKLFEIVPDYDLNVMRDDQSTLELISKLITLLRPLVLEEKPDCIIAQGDTTTLVVSALVAFYRKIPFFHVEAGLRTGNISLPFPEEMHRVVSDRLATLNFAPSESCKKAMLSEAIPEECIYVTGNTVVDALIHIDKIDIPHHLDIDPNKRLILVTGHRRDSFGEPLEHICDALIQITEQFPDVQILYPVHLNPHIKDYVYQKLAHHQNILLTPPLAYDVFVAVMKASYLIITDSGGIQEEAPVLGKPLLITRSETERIEVVEQGGAKLCHLETKEIYEAASVMLQDETLYQSMAKKRFIYGSGDAANQIVEIIKKYFEIQ